MKRVTIEISTKGDVKLGVEGVAGDACRDLTRSIEEAIGKVETVTPTAEYLQQDQALGEAQGEGAGLGG